MGGVQFRADDLEHPASPFYFDKAKMGVGMGVEGVNSSGTFGGYIFETTTMKRYRLTNGHVTAMHLKQGVSASVVVQKAEGVKMVQNSHQDHLRTIETAEAYLKDWVAKDELYSGGSPRVARNRADAAADVEALKMLSRNFGKVKLFQCFDIHRSVALPLAALGLPPTYRSLPMQALKVFSASSTVRR